MEVSKDKKTFLIKESKTFCVFPWNHLNVTPKGDAYPCCSSAYTESVGNVNNNSMLEIINNDAMKTLRLNMLNEKESSICTYCYQHEAAGASSFRQFGTEHFADRFDDFMAITKEDGSIDKFEMGYFDIRFSNLCNFKCRTCGSEFSSSWGIEERTFVPDHYTIIHANKGKTDLLEETLGHIKHMKVAYFAGGEPLINEEHYIILEEMIRQGRTDIFLRYNSNVSSFKFKDKDIVNLWKHFDRVDVSCSIDHYGDRAEYIRHGTKWDQVEANLRLIQSLPHVKYESNCVLSMFNYLTLKEYFTYMVDNGLYTPKESCWTIYKALSPSYYCVQSLPEELKAEGRRKMEEAMAYMRTKGFSYHLDELERCIPFAESANTWDANKARFIHLTKERDKIRDENFVTTFPELKSLFD
jgi:radical SAM protein with 4Fe4S-binding SPASM domain